MKWSFFGEDLGVLVFGYKLLQRDPTANIDFYINTKPVGACQSEADFFEPGLVSILKDKTRFGRVGLVYDRKNDKMRTFCKKIDLAEFEYNPQKKSRKTEKHPRIFAVETQVLVEMAKEGLADTVEFRRLARKYLRRAKGFQVDTLFWVENIFAETKTRQILEHLGGAQIKNLFPVDFLSVQDKTKSPNRKLTISSTEDPEFIKKRAQKILKTKISETDFCFKKA